MDVKLKSSIPDVIEIAERAKRDAIARKAQEWKQRVDDILRAQPENIEKLAGEVRVEITDEGFVGISDSEGMKFIEFGMDEQPSPDNLVAGMATIEQIAPMRRALSTL